MNFQKLLIKIQLDTIEKNNPKKSATLKLSSLIINKIQLNLINFHEPTPYTQSFLPHRS